MVNKIIIFIFIALLISAIGVTYYVLGSKSQNYNQENKVVALPTIPEITIPTPTSTLAPTSLPPTPSTIPIDWVQLAFTNCYVNLNYPKDWGNDLRIKQKDCQADYQRTIVGEKQNTSVLFDVQPTVFMGKETIASDTTKQVDRLLLHGIDVIVKETTDVSSDGITLIIRNYYFQKGTFILRMLAFYEKSDINFATLLDAIAKTVTFAGPDIFYTNYAQQIEQEYNQFLATVPTIHPTIDINARLSELYNSIRKSTVNDILNALGYYYTDNNNYPTEITNTPQRIAKTGADLCKELLPNYFAALPVDPSLRPSPDDIVTVTDCSSNYDTGYTVQKIGNQITVSAPFSKGEVISVIR